MRFPGLTQWNALWPTRPPGWGLAVVAGAILLVAGAGPAVADVTGAADNLRTGWYPDEATLTPGLVQGRGFKPVFEDSLHGGQIYAQPLTADGTLLVVTEDNRAYGLNPVTGAVRWEKSFGTPVNSLEAPIECTDLAPHVGITGTPVIDTASNIAYFVSNRYVSGESGPMAWYMHAIELSNGEEVSGFPVEIAGEAQNLPGVKFEASQQLQRPALLLMNGVVYAGFGSHCDHSPYEGWIVGVSTSGGITTRWATSSKGAAVWQAGGGLISDAPGQILFSTGNGIGAEQSPPPGPGKAPPKGRLGDSVLRVQVQPEGNLRATDFFSPFNNVELDEKDLDLGSAAPVALPPAYFGTPSIPDLLVQDGKDGWVYLLNGQDLGGMGQGLGGTDKVVQRLGPYGGVWDGLAAWPGDGGYVYIPSVSPPGAGGGSRDHLRFFKYGVDEKGEPSLSLAATSPDTFDFGSGSPIVTSNAATSGSAILWITRCPFNTSCAEATLRAYDPVPVAGVPKVLWEAPIGHANKFSRPDASNGHIYVGNREGEVFGYSGPALTPSTSSLDLGTAPVGGRIAGDVTFTNTGTPLTVSAVRPPPAPYEATGLPAVGSVIEPGQVITMPVTFSSAASGSFTGSLGLSTQAGETNVTLLATAASQASGPGATVTTASFIEPLVNLTRLQVRFSASTAGRRRHQARVIFTLSTAGTVNVVIQRRVISHRCERGARVCAHYVSTRIKLRVAGHAGTNVLGLSLGQLSAGSYRLAATPITRSGVRGFTRYVHFKTAR